MVVVLSPFLRQVSVGSPAKERNRKNRDDQLETSKGGVGAARSDRHFFKRGMPSVLSIVNHGGISLNQ